VAALAILARKGHGSFIDPTYLINELLAIRSQAREAKDYSLSDRIRNCLMSSNIEIIDTNLGPEWKILNRE
jgi:cysteinyl-tRNA synthetase